jgi:hypothetical protein
MSDSPDDRGRRGSGRAGIARGLGRSQVMDQQQPSSERCGVDSANAAGEPGSDALDALLIAAEPRISAWFASLVVREGYRVRVVDSVATAMAAASEHSVDIAFASAPSFVVGTNRTDVSLLLDQLRPLSSSGVPVVVLGDGWESRVADADTNRELRGVQGRCLRTQSSRRPHDEEDVPHVRQQILA